MVRRLERHIRSENRLATPFGSGPTVDRLHRRAADDTDAAGLAAS